MKFIVKAIIIMDLEKWVSETDYGRAEYQMPHRLKVEADSVQEALEIAREKFATYKGDWYKIWTTEIKSTQLVDGVSTRCEHSVMNEVVKKALDKR